MRFYFIMEDQYGPPFIKKLFQKKRQENIFSGILVDARHIPVPSTKMDRIITSAESVADRIIILADADSAPLDEKEKNIYKYIDKTHRNKVRIVLFDNEIEEWICHSEGFRITDKASKVLKSKLKPKYKKNELEDYASKINCVKLKTNDSFNRFLDAIK